ncbi:MAG: AAA domain-containing protein, partial [Clostridiaceae bacterium]|nr:AAA domain-containing protein [Clostridiaceae bacterium]
GYEEGGQLTEAVRRKPYCVILFDEIEKAHNEVFTILLQLLDDGRLTDSQGRTVNFKNTVIIMTSNIGSHYLTKGVNNHGEIREDVRELVMNELRARFRPEFLNRVDEIVMFKPLMRNEIMKIVELSLEEIRKRLHNKNIKLYVTSNAVQFITDAAYSPVYGARPIKRYLQKNVESQIAKMIISGEVEEDSTVVIDEKDGGLVISSRK